MLDFVFSYRCPLERKQFYRQLVKNLKYLNIDSTPTVQKKQHYEMSHKDNMLPFDTSAKRLWLEICFKMKNCSPFQHYEDWLFFQRADVNTVLQEIVHFTFDEQGDKSFVFSKGLYKVNYMDYLSLVQQEALEKVTKVLEELDRVESFYMNDKKMGDVHDVYRTLLFRRRMSCLILWQKITHGLAESLYGLSNWLGAEIMLPDVSFNFIDCMSSPTGSQDSLETISNQDCSLSSSLPIVIQHTKKIQQTSALEIDSELVSKSDLFEPQDNNQSKQLFLASSLPQSDNFSIVSWSPICSDSIFPQQNRTKPYREFVSNSLKRIGLRKTIQVN